MIDGGAYDGETEGDVDAEVEGERLEGDEALVVVGADVGIDLFSERGEEGGVGRERADDIDAFGTGFFQTRDEELDLFAPEKAAFAGMGIEAGHGEFGLAAADGLHRLMGEADDFEDALFAKEIGDVFEGDVSGDERAGDFSGSEHHGVIGRVRFFNEILGVAGVVDARAMPRFFVDGIGNDGGEAAAQGSFDGGFEAGEAVGACFGGDNTGFNLGGERKVEDVIFKKRDFKAVG